jgi:hypothetical protein
MENVSSENTKRSTIRIAPFAFALLCFLMPFFQVSCQGQKVADITGLETAIGKNIENKNPRTGEVKVDRMEPKILGMVALGLAALATAVAASSGKTSQVIALLSGVGSFISILGVWGQLRQDVAKNGPGMVTIDPQFGFYLACAGLLIGAWLAMDQLKRSKEKPVPVEGASN